jgi:hypothetical protein
LLKRDKGAFHVGSVVGTQRPDFTALYRGVPVLIVEETEDDDLDGTQADIVNKFAWIPHLRRLSLFIGIVVCFRYIRVLLLRRDQAIETVYDGNCEDKADRLAFLQPAVNTARVVKYYQGLVRSSSLPLNQWHSRGDGKWVLLDFKGVDIKCPTPTFYRMVEFYDKIKHIPFIERLSASRIDDAHDQGIIIWSRSG